MIAYIARHAWAHPRDSQRWPDDADRPLTEEGQARYRKLIELLASRGFEPRVIATSPYVRCVQTAEIIAEIVSGQPQVCPLDELEPNSDIEGIVAWIQQRPSQENVCLVGHAPDVSCITAEMIAQPEMDETHLRFAKGGIAAVEDLSNFHHQLGQLQWHVTAKILGI